MTSDFHSKPFDENTQVKLTLFQSYLREWLPVFLAPRNGFISTVNVFDFFCGPGRDINGKPGSPLITMKELGGYYHNIISKKISVNLFFNELKKRKIQCLEKIIATERKTNKPYTILTSHFEFKESFEKYLPLMTKPATANFLFLDQTGVKHITKDVFQTIINLNTTDFLFFISSSTVHRFSGLDEISKYIPIDKKNVSDTEYLNIHRAVYDYYKSLIPAYRSDYHLASFSIKKGANIYGLIFGSGHARGIEKFLRKCWALDPERGEANFDIDHDNIDHSQPSLFPEHNRPKKVILFEEELREGILNGSLKTNIDVYYFTIQSGFLPKHAREAFMSLIEQKILPKQVFRISYDTCVKNKNISQIQGVVNE